MCQINNTLITSYKFMTELLLYLTKDWSVYIKGTPWDETFSMLSILKI